MEERRGRSRTRSGRSASKYPRGMSFSASRSRSRSARAAPVTVLYMPSAEETKYFDTSQEQTIASSADWTGTEVPCTNYVQSDGTTVGAYTDSALIPSAIGAGFGQVVGSKYKIKKIRCRGQIISATLSDQADVLRGVVARVALVMDTRPNGAQGQGEDVFTDIGTAPQCNWSFMAMGAGNAGRFRILKDFFVVLQPGQSGTDGANTNSTTRTSASYSFTWKPKVPVEVLLKANSSTPTVASLSNCNVFLLAHCDGTNTTIEGASRAYYVG